MGWVRHCSGKECGRQKRAVVVIRDHSKRTSCDDSRRYMAQGREERAGYAPKSQIANGRAVGRSRESVSSSRSQKGMQRQFSVSLDGDRARALRTNHRC